MQKTQDTKNITQYQSWNLTEKGKELLVTIHSITTCWKQKTGNCQNAKANFKLQDGDAGTVITPVNDYKLCKVLNVRFMTSYTLIKFPWWFSGKESVCQCRRLGFAPWMGKIPWRRKQQPTPAFLPGKSQGQRSLQSSVASWLQSMRSQKGWHDLASKGQ